MTLLRAILAIWLLFGSSAHAGGLAGAILLCFGADGQIALKFAADAPVAKKSDHLTMFGSKHHSLPCTDVSVGDLELNLTASGIGRPVESAKVAILAKPAQDWGRPTGKASPISRTTGRDSSIVLRSTTVLLL